MEYKKDLEIVNLEFKKKNFIKAKKVCKEILVKYPDKTYPYNLYGLILQKLGDYKESLFYFKKALEIDSHLIYTKHNLANSYKNLFKYLNDALLRAFDPATCTIEIQMSNCLTILRQLKVIDDSFC